ncbi:hypothetical protein ACEQPO_01460 [Bacillus sp. SL00103]
MTDALRDRKTLLLTVLIPLLTMLGLVFFYESMIADPGDETYTVAVNEQLPTEMNQMIKEVKTSHLKLLMIAASCQRWKGECLPGNAERGRRHASASKVIAIKIHGYTTDDDSVITVQIFAILIGAVSKPSRRKAFSG